LAVFLLAFTFVGCSSETIARLAAPTIEPISADELRQLADSGEDFLLLDVREPDEIQRYGTLPNYMNIPVGEIEQRMREIPRDEPIVVACERGGRAGRAATAMEKAGFEDLRTFGFAEYRAKNYPLYYPADSPFQIPANGATPMGAPQDAPVQ